MQTKTVPPTVEPPAAAKPDSVPDTEYSTAAGRARRAAALKKVAGIWANREDIPADGLEYERELRG